MTGKVKSATNSFDYVECIHSSKTFHCFFATAILLVTSHHFIISYSVFCCSTIIRIFSLLGVGFPVDMPVMLTYFEGNELMPVLADYPDYDHLMNHVAVQLDSNEFQLYRTPVVLTLQGEFEVTAYSSFLVLVQCKMLAFCENKLNSMLGSNILLNVRTLFYFLIFNSGNVDFWYKEYTNEIFCISNEQ